MADPVPDAGSQFQGVVMTLGVGANVGGCTATLKNQTGVLQVAALDPRMQNLLETAMSKAWFVLVTYVAQGDTNVLTSVKLDITTL